MTTITRLKQFKEWLEGKLQPEKLQKAEAFYTITQALNRPDRFNAFKTLLAPLLVDEGYPYFLSCAAEDYVKHQAWCNENGIDSVPFYDECQLAKEYPRAFKHDHEMILFRLHFDCQVINTDKAAC